ncbi:MAG: response regulator [Pseudomonadales bacterium]|nr:response regulator [Pseudomonadales bacterium]MDG1441912.1 response regulator [Pseudomonadales bacterium]
MMNILIVDDQPNVVKALARVLRKPGIHITGVDSAEKALSKMLKEDYDMVISDLKMPVMDGIDFLSVVSELYPAVKQILLSGHAGPKELKNAINQCSIEQFISKPWSVEEMQSIVWMEQDAKIVIS